MRGEFLLLRTEKTERAKKRFVREKILGSRHNGGGESSFSDPLGTPNVFAEVAVFASHEGGAGRRACA